MDATIIPMSQQINKAWLRDPSQCVVRTRAAKAEHLTKIPSLPGGTGGLCLFSSARGQTDRLLSLLTPCYPPYMVAEQGGLRLLRSCGARLKIGQRGGLDEGLLTSPAFGNKRKWILFAHTEENSSSNHTSWPCQAPRRHGSTSALTHGMARPISALSSSLELQTTEDTEGISGPHTNGTISLDAPHREKRRPGLHLFKVTQYVTDDAESRAGHLSLKRVGLLRRAGCQATLTTASSPGHLGPPSREVKAQDTGLG